MKNQGNVRIINSFNILLVVFVVTSVILIKCSIEEGVVRERAYVASLIDNTTTGTGKVVSVAQCKIASRRDKLLTARDFLLKTSWQDEELNVISLRQLNYRRAHIVSL